jgi:ATP-dependent Clp protease ATP-binding subunit ClpC
MSSEPSRIRWTNQDPVQTPQQHLPEPNQSSAEASRATSLNNQIKTPVLDQIGRDLTALAREGKLNPLFGRKNELLQLERILLRKQKSNPILIGAPGVGKTALVEGLATLIVNQEAVQDFRNIRIVEIIPAQLVSGTEYRGTFEKRLQSLLSEAKGNSNLILFIDEIHTMIRAGAVEGGSLDAANILKPALARGEIRCIGATTSDEFDQLIKTDPAFERRFEPLVLEEPTESESIEILTAAISSYEEHHHVKILPEAVNSAVRLSCQHILDRRLPDKAFDLLDTACTLIRLPSTNPIENSNISLTVDSDVVEKALSNKLNIPVEKLTTDIKEKLSGLEEFLNQRIIGQSLALNHISSAILNSYAGLNKINQPKHVFAFFGASGIGKTATAKALAEFLFSSPDSLIRLDMSEYKEPYTVSRLLGSPPGYIGYDDEGTFATRLRRQPFSIVLLDEIEKAHQQVHDTFLHIFDEGRFTDTHGRCIDARHAIFILTSNLYTLNEIKTNEDYEIHASTIRQSLCNYFRPEFINRINEVVLFQELAVDKLMEIAKLEIENLNLRLSRFKIDVKLNDEAICLIANLAHDPNSGARAVSRIIQKQIAEPISKSYIAGTLRDGNTLDIIVQNDILTIRNLT